MVDLQPLLVEVPSTHLPSHLVHDLVPSMTDVARGQACRAPLQSTAKTAAASDVPLQRMRLLAEVLSGDLISKNLAGLLRFQRDGAA